jgi:chromosome segregation ATPase
MNCANKALLVVLVVMSLGLWGCSQNSSQSAPRSARLRDLESRYTKLEEDYAAAIAARDQAVQNQQMVEQQRTQLQRQLEQARLVIRERDELRHQVSQRTSERDTIQAHLTQLGRELQNLVGKIDAASSTVTTPVTTAPTPPQGKS